MLHAGAARIVQRFDPPLPATQPGDSVGVRLEIEVKADSTIGEVKLVETPSPLDSLAIAAVRIFLVEPAIEDSVAVASWMPVTVWFRAPELEIGAPPDSTISRAELERRVGERILRCRSDFRERFLQPAPHLIRENFHLYEPAPVEQTLLLDGLPERSKYVTTAHLLQTFSSFDSVSTAGPFLRSDSRGYSLEPAFTEAFMGLGDEHMNHIAASLRKGSALGVRNLDIRFDYVGYEGYWSEKSDKSANFRGRIDYRRGDHTLTYDYRSIHQDPTPEALLSGYAIGYGKVLHEDLNRHRLVWSNPWLDLGLLDETDRYLGLDIGKQEHTRKGFMLHRRLGGFEATAVLSTHRVPEYLVGAGYRLGAISGDARLDIAGKNLMTGSVNDRIRLNESWSAIVDGEGMVRADSTRDRLIAVRTPLGIAWKAALLHCEARFAPGLRVNPSADPGEDKSAGFLDVDFTARADLPLSACTLHGSAVLARGAGMTLPDFDVWRVDANVWLEYDLRHENSFLLGGSWRQYHEALFPDGNELWDDHALTAWTGFEVTRSFAIQLEAYNLTNDATFSRRPYAPTHYNFTVHWLFVN
jgi:hypothetical protein